MSPFTETLPHLRAKIHAFCAGICIIAAFFFHPSNLYAEKMMQMHTADVIVVYPASLKEKAEEVGRLMPDLTAELSALLFAWPADLKPSVFLMGDAAKFENMTGNPYISAFAVPKKNIIVIDCTRLNAHPFTLKITLKHELCHLLLHHYVPNLPKWLDEGICQWSSDGISELLIQNKGDAIRTALLSGKIIALRDLETHFPHDRNGLVLAYETGKSFTEFLIREFGKHALFRILENLKNGDDTETAVQKALSLSLADAEQQWHSQLRKTGTWFVWISVHLYEILFLLAALVTVYGFFRMLIRQRNYADEEEDGEDEYANED